MLSKSRQAQKTSNYMKYPVENSLRNRNQISGCERKWRVGTNGYMISSWGNDMYSKIRQ